MKKMDCDYGFEEIAHTADYAIKVWAHKIDDLYREAAKGMMALMGASGKKDLRDCDCIEIVLEADNHENLLMDYLSEILFHCEVKNSFVVSQEIEVSGFKLSARILIGEILKQEKWIKAVTYHNLQVKHTHMGYETLIVFDV